MSIFKRKKNDTIVNKEDITDYYELIQASVDIVLDDRYNAAFPVNAAYNASYFTLFSFILNKVGAIDLIQRRLILQVYTLGVIKQTGEDISYLIERRLSQLERLSEVNESTYIHKYVEVVENEQNQSPLMEIPRMKDKCISITCSSISDVLKTIATA